MKEIIKKTYGLEVLSISKVTTGAGSNVYDLKTNKGRYILKYIEENSMNRPENEPDIISFIKQKGINVANFIKTKSGKYIWSDEKGSLFHLQEYVEGKVYNLNTAPKWLLQESPQVLGKIHNALKDYKELPEGIGENFIKYMTPCKALQSYEKSLIRADYLKNQPIIEDLKYRIKLTKILEKITVNINKFTKSNTHGDYFISQLICQKSKIKAVIDWTTACVHPVSWEIIRSYTYSDPYCINGEINIENFKAYVLEYLKFNQLSSYDLSQMPYLYFYQLGVCDYYSQYFNSTVNNRHIILHQAKHATLLLKWFEKNITRLSDELSKGFY